MSKTLFETVEELFPHRGNIVLIDRVIDWGDDWVETAVEHREPSLFSREDGSTPAWIGIEYMAQTIGAFAGLRARQAGRPVRIGFLMGTNKYESTVPAFEKDMAVTVRAEQVFSDSDNLALFDCMIFSDRLLARAQVKAVQPDDPNTILKGLSPI
jgi:predicted hotdog family 3-hydroxylacyl-ACP dehydratase